MKKQFAHSKHEKTLKILQANDKIIISFVSGEKQEKTTRFNYPATVTQNDIGNRKLHIKYKNLKKSQVINYNNIINVEPAT